MIGWIIYAVICLIAAEFGLHIIYHAITGKAGLNEPAFQYIKEIFKWKKN